MWRREDRRDLAWLGLWVAVYGLAFAPVVHAVYGHGAAQPPFASSNGQDWVTHAWTDSSTPSPLSLTPSHDERAPHSHDASGKPGHTHGFGSVEHLQAVALPWLLWLPPQVFWTDLGLSYLGQERSRPGRPLRPTAMPQAP